MTQRERERRKNFTDQGLTRQYTSVPRPKKNVPDVPAKMTATTMPEIDEKLARHKENRKALLDRVCMKALNIGVQEFTLISEQEFDAHMVKYMKESALPSKQQILTLRIPDAPKPSQPPPAIYVPRHDLSAKSALAALLRDCQGLSTGYVQSYLYENIKVLRASPVARDDFVKWGHGHLRIHVKNAVKAITVIRDWVYADGYKQSKDFYPKTVNELRRGRRRTYLEGGGYFDRPTVATIFSDNHDDLLRGLF